ncbi:uncharacterized protein LOC121054967 isoform X2 [Oryza brachyantha]|uniref:uncharacterized protein LOC121054967 isoform X2 n=1 Tax=Oryza brachyantha TaxID=4533 RepID=UPI001ADBE49E|nr:uncharacterized protein LOC121054967 isoform X2 [Oryza brachyantha]
MAGGSGSNGGRTRNGAAASTEAASGGTATTVAALVVLLAVASLLVLLLSPTPVAMRADGDGVGVPHEPVELAFGLAGHESWLDAVRAWAKLALLKLRPPEPRGKVAWCCSRNGATAEMCVLTAACVCQGTICGARRR